VNRRPSILFLIKFLFSSFIELLNIIYEKCPTDCKFVCLLIIILLFCFVCLYLFLCILFMRFLLMQMGDFYRRFSLLQMHRFFGLMRCVRLLGCVSLLTGLCGYSGFLGLPREADRY